MMRTQKASWMTTFSGSWRPLAACLPEQVGVHPGRALLTDFLRGKRQDLESICHQARANIHPGTQAWRENLATTTSTNMCITSTTQAVGSPGSRRKRRLRCAYSLAVLPTAWALILWSIQGQLLLPCDCNNIFFFLTILLTAFFLTVSKVSESTGNLSRRGLTTQRGTEKRWRKTRRFFCGSWREKKKWFSIKRALMGERWWFFSWTIFYLESWKVIWLNVWIDWIRFKSFSLADRGYFLKRYFKKWATKLRTQKSSSRREWLTH